MPFVLSAVIVLLDQITKAIVVRNVPLIYESGFTIEVIGDFLRIIHARNLGMAFSLGNNLPPVVRFLLLVVVSGAVLVWLVVSLYRSAETTDTQRWFLALVLGGGIGNLIDRVFRPAGVVDFVDVAWFGLEVRWPGFLAWERWPTFNVADSAISVGVVLIIASLVFTGATTHKDKRSKERKV